MDHIGKKQMHESLLKLDGKSQTDYRNKTEQERSNFTKKEIVFQNV